MDARADLYGVGCVAYFLATGSAPFTGKSLLEVCAHHLHRHRGLATRADRVSRDVR